MLKRLLPFFFVAAAIPVLASPTTPCAAGSLTSYISSFPASNLLGCSIGILDYTDFSYHAVTNAPAVGSIIVTPTGQGFEFTNSSGPFTATAGQVVQFEIDYNIAIDPAPILTGADNALDPPSGDVSVTEYFCNDRVYVYTGTCFPPTGSPDTLTVGTVPPLSTSASITFQDPAASFQEVGILFTLDASDGTPASFDGLAAGNIVVASPEPAATFLVGLFLAAGSYTLKKQRKR